MAFQKAYQDVMGTNHAASYWRVKVGMYDPHIKESVAQLVGYINAGATGQYSPITAFLFSCRGPAFDQYMSIAKLNELGMNIIRAWYLYLKTLPDWAAALDV